MNQKTKKPQGGGRRKAAPRIRLSLTLPDHARQDGKHITDVLTGDEFNGVERIGSLCELLDTLSGAIGNGYLPGLLWYLRLRVLLNVSKLDEKAQRRLFSDHLSDGALCAGRQDHWFPAGFNEWGQVIPVFNHEAAAEGEGMEVCALVEWLFDLLMLKPPTHRGAHENLLQQKCADLMTIVDDMNERSAHFQFTLSRLRMLRAAVCKSIEEGGRS